MIGGTCRGRGLHRPEKGFDWRFAGESEASPLQVPANVEVFTRGPRRPRKNNDKISANKNITKYKYYRREEDTAIRHGGFFIVPFHLGRLPEKCARQARRTNGQRGGDHRAARTDAERAGKYRA